MIEEGVKAQDVGCIRNRLGMAAVRAQCHSLLDRLVGMGKWARGNCHSIRQEEESPGVGSSH